jgi:hypothetical protein
VKLAGGTISLPFTTGTAVTIRGRDLHARYVALVRHQVVTVTVNEADEPTVHLVPESTPVVLVIDVKT